MCYVFYSVPETEACYALGLIASKKKLIENFPYKEN